MLSMWLLLNGFPQLLLCEADGDSWGEPRTDEAGSSTWQTNVSISYDTLCIHNWVPVSFLKSNKQAEWGVIKKTITSFVLDSIFLSIQVTEDQKSPLCWISKLTSKVHLTHLLWFLARITEQRRQSTYKDKQILAALSFGSLVKFDLTTLARSLVRLTR